MKEKVMRFLAKQWALIWIIAAVAVLGGMFTYATYTKANKGKSVVATYEEIGDRFSSNYLNIGTPSENPQYAYAIDNSTAPSASVTICNYSQGNSGYFYDRDIAYTLSVALVKSNGDPVSAAEIGEKSITVQLTASAGNQSVTFDKNNLTAISNWGGTLRRGQPSNDICNVTFDAGQIAELDDNTKTKLYVEIIATPTPRDNYRDLNPISMRMGVAKRENEVEAAWEGYFNDNPSSKVATSDAPIAITSGTYDGFNYVIEGIGKGDIELRYDSTKIEINALFVTEVNGTLSSPDANGIRTLTFSVNSNDIVDDNGTVDDKTDDVVTSYGINRYDTQFYKTSVSEADYPNWYTINNYITYFHFDEDDS